MNRYKQTVAIALIFFLLAVFSCLNALSNDDLQFLTDKEQFQILIKHSSEIMRKAEQGDIADLKAVLNYSERADLPELATLCHKRLAIETASLEDALQWLLLMQSSKADSSAIKAGIDEMMKVFSAPLDQILLLQYSYGGLESELETAVANSAKYNSVIEASAKELIDEISTTREDSLAIKLVDDFFSVYPRSQYRHIALYYSLYHLSNQKNWNQLLFYIESINKNDPVECYVAALYLLSPTLRKNLGQGNTALEQAAELLNLAKTDKAQSMLYESYSPADWQARVKLQQAKLQYYRLLETNGLYGDEEKLLDLSVLNFKHYKALLKNLKQLKFNSNDRGEQAELHFWTAKALLLKGKPAFYINAAKQLSLCLVKGAPRKKYDEDALKLIATLRDELKLKDTPMVWMRKLMKYKGITFNDVSSEAGLDCKNYTRVALADYNNDSQTDILFNGKYLYRNEGGLRFSETTAEHGLADLNSAGGIFADFNKDGLLDLVSYSHAEDGSGDMLMKNMDNTRFARVNERAGDIDDRYPTEAAAWIDVDGSGYPSIYSANYEKWQVQSGFPDDFWQNDKGYFSDQSAAKGFLTPVYTHDPGQAGRGVSPADFDNDGKQEIFVSNYRLNRNFCWKRSDSLFVDVAALHGLAGHYKKGYFGHSIGADWGDIDNDGDLDLFIANLAHPRYLDISDISMFLRNDGLGYRVVEQDTVFYWQFTDITKQAGITYDELHSDPLFFDADNDGLLDLFITSVYVNERSYLYRNKGDGTFEDITCLAGARVYNGWGNASADLDRDGLQDLVVGSGSGTKILKNTTPTSNRSITVKPIWKNDTIILESDPRQFNGLPNSPAFGTRVIVSVTDSKGRTKNLMRELSSAKGTGSQCAQELHFGLGTGTVKNIKRFEP